MLILEIRADVSTVPPSTQWNSTTVISKVLAISRSFFFSIRQSWCRFLQFYLMRPQNLCVYPGFSIFPAFLLPLEILHLSCIDVAVYCVICCNSILHSELWLLFCSFISFKVQHFKSHIKNNSQYYCLLCANSTVKTCPIRYNNLGNT